MFATSLVMRVVTLVLTPLGGIWRVGAFLLSPVGTVVGSLLSNPIGRAIIYAVLAVTLLWGDYLYGYVHGRVREHAIMVAQSQKEIANAVASANAARAAAQNKLARGRFSNRPGVLPGRVRHGSDGYARD